MNGGHVQDLNLGLGVQDLRRTDQIDDPMRDKPRPSQSAAQRLGGEPPDLGGEG